MSFTINTWIYYIFSGLCIISIIIGLIIINKKIPKTRKELNNIISFILMATISFTWMGVSILMVLNTDVVNKFGTTNEFKVVDYNTTYNYNKLTEIKKSINNSYDDFDNINNANYCYDYLQVVLTKKHLNFFELISWWKTFDPNTIYDSKSELIKNTEKLTLNGVLKTTIDNCKNKYSIDGYILSDDDNGKIASLANNQNVQLEIVYNKEKYNNDKNISEYVIVNADTK